MKETEKNMIKNQILLSLRDCKPKTIVDLAKNVNKEGRLVAYLAEELEKDELVTLRDISSKEFTFPKDYFVRISNSGVFFIEINGGFKRINRRIKFQNSWRIIKFVAVVFNAVAILAIASYGLYQSNENNNLKKANSALKQQLEKANSIFNNKQPEIIVKDSIK